MICSIEHQPQAFERARVIFVLWVSLASNNNYEYSLDQFFGHNGHVTCALQDCEVFRRRRLLQKTRVRRLLASVTGGQLRFLLPQAMEKPEQAPKYFAVSFSAPPSCKRYSSGRGVIEICKSLLQMCLLVFLLPEWFLLPRRLGWLWRAQDKDLMMFMRWPTDAMADRLVNQR